MSGVELTRPITPPDRMEEENQYMAVVTASIRQLNLETTGIDLGVLSRTLVWWLSTVKELEE